jgi:hypothetical protein
MDMRRTMFLFAVIACATGIGCASPLSRGVRSYHAGAPAQAMEQLLEAEANGVSEAPRTQARYALYRGLTHLSLGDAESAERWLAEAKAWCDRDDEVLDADDRGRLLAAWGAIGHEPGTWGSGVLERR